MAAAEELAGRIGQTAEACEALGVARSTLYRRRQPSVSKPKRRPRPHRALDETERAQVLGALHSERFVDKAPAQVWATLLDEGSYCCSVRTMYRILEEHGEVRERRNQLRRLHYRKPELLAEAPNQVWSWASCPKIQTNSRLARRAVSIVIAPWRAPDLGRVGGDVGDSGSPYAQGKHRPATVCHCSRAETWIQAWAAPGPERASPIRRGSPGLDSGPLGWPLFRCRTAPGQRPAPTLWRKRGTRKSGLETKTENEARSALLARLW